MNNKSTYLKAATIINRNLKGFDDGEFKPRVSVENVEELAAAGIMGFGKYAFSLNLEAMKLAAEPGPGQDIFYDPELMAIGDDDYYLEPVTNGWFDIAKY